MGLTAALEVSGIAYNNAFMTEYQTNHVDFGNYLDQAYAFPTRLIFVNLLSILSSELFFSLFDDLLSGRQF